MATLSFETGIKTFDINGDPNRVVSFNPSDLNFIHRLYDGYMKLDALQRKYSLQADKAPEATKMMAIAHEADLEMRKIIDGIFAAPVSEIVFEGQATNAITGDGCPLWLGFLVAIMANCDETVTERENAKNPKLEALIAKYNNELHTPDERKY